MACIYLCAIIGWHLYTPKVSLTIQAPGADNRPDGATRTANDVLIGEFFMRYDEVHSDLTGQWCSFRGKDSKNIITAPEKINIASDEDYPVLWNVETGEGYASPVIYNGKVYFLDYEEALRSDALRCFSLETGRELWRRWYRVPIKRNHGFSRTVPSVGADYVITIGPDAHVMCCDPSTGNMLWSLDMQKQFKTVVPGWYAGQCPLMDNNTLVLAPAGDEILLAGFDRLTGAMVWSTPNTLGYKMSHSSVMPMTLGNKKMYVYAGIGGVCGISAEDADRGTLLWESSKWQPSVVAPSPLQISSNLILTCAGYGAGSALLKVERTGNQWIATVIDQFKSNAGISSEQQTPIFYKNTIITVLPQDGGGNRGKLACYSPSNIKTPFWTSAANERFGDGPFIVINNNLFAFKSDGELYVYEIEQQGMRLLKKQRILEGEDAWGPLAYADGRLIVRDAHHVVCLKIN